MRKILFILLACLTFCCTVDSQVVFDTPQPEYLELPSIARVKAVATADKQKVLFKANDLLVTYINGKNLYVFDGTDGLLIYGDFSGISTGDKITADIKGDLYLYKGLTEISISAIENLTVNSQNNAVTPQVVTIADITNNFADYENELVTIKELTPAATTWESRNLTFTDDSDNALVVRDNWTVAANITFDVAVSYDVTGFVAIYANDAGRTVQLFPRSAEDFDGDTGTIVYPDPRETSLDNPYSVVELRALNATSSSEYLQEGAFVVGYIVGYINGSSLSATTAIFSAEPPAAAASTRADDPKVAASNFLLADDPTCTDIAAVVPIQLDNNSPARNDLNLADHPECLGTKVWLQGNVRKYMGVTGLHKVKHYSTDGVDFTGIIVSYQLTLIVDGEVFHQYSLYKGETISIDIYPQKEGYTFSGWSEIPETMPDHDVTITGSFIPNKYTITFEINGNVYETRTIDYGTTINVPELPELTGYTFKWDNVPTTMPAKDITIEGRYVPNNYKVTYLIDDVEYKVVNVQYGTYIVAESNPEKEGYTFSGWSEIPNTMPAHDVVVTGSFTINTYKVIYEVNGEEYKRYEVEYGTDVPVEEALEREGYTFSGWSVIPATMPAHDVVITASFTKGKYKLIYVVDGEVYKIFGYDFQDEITPEAVLEKEGYTFSGWSEIPEVMPAHDVAVTGTFTINQYTLSFMIGENLYETKTLDYCAAISIPEVPELTGYTFTWGEVPETMPAKDLTIIGEYVPNKYNVTYLIDGIFYAIMKVPYGTPVTPPDVPERAGCTFTWVDVPATMPAHDITIEGTYTDGIESVNNGQRIMNNAVIYNLNGQRLSQPQHGVNIIDGKKVMIK